MRKKESKSQITLFCFSPAAMLLTFSAEICLATYVFVRYRLSEVGRLITLILILLASFQGAEYLVCTHPNQAYPWSQFGFVAITLLPVLTINLANLLIKKKIDLSVPHFLAVTFSLIFLLAPRSIATVYCTNNYAVFFLPRPLDILYFLYYFGFLFWGLGLIFSHLVEKHSSLTSERKLLLFWLALGYLSFMLPTGTLSLLLAQTRGAIPSVMCGFAIFFAGILSFGLAPLYEKTHKTEKTHE